MPELATELVPLTREQRDISDLGHYRARRGLRRRLHHHHGHPHRRRIPPERPEGLDLNAEEAESYVAFAKTDPAQRSRGVTALLLRKGTDGMEFGEPMRKMGQRAIVCRDFFLNDVFVQFGRPIIEHQAVAFRLADMRTRIEQARPMTWPRQEAGHRFGRHRRGGHGQAHRVGDRRLLHLVVCTRPASALSATRCPPPSAPRPPTPAGWSSH